MSFRQTKQGMVREDKSSKFNYMDYLDPVVLARFAIHMKQGELVHGRGNWKKGGYPQKEYLESLLRHFMSLWKEFENESYGYEDHAAAILFNIQGFMYEQDRGTETILKVDTEH